MTDQPDQVTSKKRGKRDGVVALSLVAVVAGMVGLSFAAVPLYRKFCAATGYDGTPGRAVALPGKVVDIPLTIRFDTNVAEGMPWSFVPEQEQMTTKAGASTLAFFKVTNNSDRPVTGRAAFNVVPGTIARYFKKIECFCFTKQRLEPGQTAEMPVTFFVDPKFLTDDDTKSTRDITLSYTFFRSDNGEGVAATAPPETAPRKSGS